MKEYYDILGLEEGAGLEDVEQKYNQLVEEFNPDNQEDSLKDFFKSEQIKVKEAYEAISQMLIDSSDDEVIEEDTIEEDTIEEDTIEEDTIEEDIIDYSSVETPNKEKITNYITSENKKWIILGSSVIVFLIIFALFRTSDEDTARGVIDKSSSCSQDSIGCYLERDVAHCKSYYESCEGSSIVEIGCVWGDCENGKGVFLWHFDDRYMPSGKSRYYGPSNVLKSEVVFYTGGWRKGRCDGFGQVLFPDHSGQSHNYKKYVGDWRSGRWDGQGTLTYRDGGRYVGSFKRDKRHGYGIMKYSHGGVDEGEWYYGEFQGIPCEYPG